MRERHLVTNAYLEALRDGTGREVGDREAPTDEEGNTAKMPFLIVYAIPGGGYDGSLATPEDDVDYAYQVTSVGASRESAEWMADQARSVTIGRDSDGAYKHRIDGVHERFADGGPQGDDGPEGPRDHEVYSTHDRFVLRCYGG